MRCGADAATHKLTDREARLGELYLQMQLLTGETGRAGDSQKRLETRVGELELAKQWLKSKEAF